MPVQRHSVRRRRVGRLTATLAGLSAAAVLAAAAGTASAAGDFQNGTASAIAQSYKINPASSGLSLGITFGLSLSDYANTVARAESRAIDLGVVGTTLAAEGCDGGDATLPAESQPQRLFVDSRDEGADKGKTEQERYAPFITKSARANDTPESEAVTTSAPIDVPGLLHVEGARARTLTHVVDGKVREALATSDIASVALGGTAVQLRGMHWESRYVSGGNAKPSASFTVNEFLVNGKPQPMPADSKALTDAINAVLGNVGIVVRPPAFRSDNGIQFVEPLAIAVVPNETRDGLVRPILENAHAVREPLYDALLKISCKFGSSFIAPSDIVVASLTGVGQFSVELGGVQASSGELKTTSLLGNFANAADLPLALPASGDLAVSAGGSSGTLPSAASAGGGGSSGAAGGKSGASGGAGTRINVTPAAVTAGSRGGKLAIVSAAALGLLALLAEADRRAMRRGRRTIPTEAR